MDFLGFLDKLGQGAGGVADAMYQAQVSNSRIQDPLAFQEADFRNQVLRERQAAREAILQNPQALGQLNQIIPNAEQFLQAGGDLESLGQLRQMVLGTDRPAAIQEDLYYQTLPDKERRNVFSGLQGRTSIVDLGDRYVLTDRVTSEQREIMKNTGQRSQGTVTAQPRNAPAPIQPQNTDFIDMPLPPVGNDYGDGFDQLDLVPDPTMIETPQFEPAGIKGLTPDKAAEIEKDKRKMAGAKTRVTSVLNNLMGNYQKLNEMGALPDPQADVSEQIAIDAGVAFPKLARYAGSEAAPIREEIAAMRPTLLNEIRQATEMGAKGLDSEKELEFYLQAATDPNKTFAANQAAIAALDAAYGLGSTVKVNPDEIEKLRKEFEEKMKSDNMPKTTQGGWRIVE